APVAAMLAPIGHCDTAAALACERAFLAALDGSCRTPIAGHAVIEAGRLSFHGMILTPDGTQVHEIGAEGLVEEAEKLGAEAGARIRDRAGPTFFATWS